MPVLNSAVRCGGVPEWLKGADCKSVGLRLRWFESNLLHHSATMNGSGQRRLDSDQQLNKARGGSSSMAEP